VLKKRKVYVKKKGSPEYVDAGRYLGGRILKLWAGERL